MCIRDSSYTATITGSNGPVTATLMGLDGQPTQSIPVFRLPGLSTGAILLQADLASLGTGAVTVQVKSLDDRPLTSDNTATVIAEAAPVTPALTSVSPSSVTAGSPDTTITLTGTNFTSTSVAEFNGTPLATTFISATQETAVVPAADNVTPGTYSITVVTPGPQGGASNALNYTVSIVVNNQPTNPTATVTSLNVGSSPVFEFTPVTIVLNGSGFAPGATVTFDGSTFTPDSVTPTQITVTVTASDEGTFEVAVVNPGQAPVSGGTAPVQEEFVAGETRDANHLFISEVLRDLLRHAPNLSEINYYTAQLEQGMTAVQVVHEIEFEPGHHEFINLEINDAYEQFYHRSAFSDPTAFAAWAPYLMGGNGTPSHTLEQLEAALVGSSEYQTLYPTYHPQDNPNDFLNAFFEDALGRPATATDRGNAQNQTPQQVAAAVFSGDEFRQQLLNAYYQEYLDHGYTPSAANPLDGALPVGMSSEDEIANIIGNPNVHEFFNKTVP